MWASRPTGARRKPPAGAASIFPVRALDRSASGDFARFDLVLAMDGANYDDLKQIAPKDQRHKIRRFLDFAPHAGTKDVPDPFFGEAEGFDHALDLIEAAARGLLAELLSDEAASAKKGA